MINKWVNNLFSYKSCLWQAMRGKALIWAMWRHGNPMVGPRQSKYQITPKIKNVRINNRRTQEKNLVEFGYVIRTNIIYDLHLVSFLLLTFLWEKFYLSCYQRQTLYQLSYPDNTPMDFEPETFWPTGQHSSLTNWASQKRLSARKKRYIPLSWVCSKISYYKSLKIKRPNFSLYIHVCMHIPCPMSHRVSDGKSHPVLVRSLMAPCSKFSALFSKLTLFYTMS
jgi:hypothetical protein